MYDGASNNFSFGFADVSWAGYYEELPDHMKWIVQRHAKEFSSLEDVKRFVKKIQLPRGNS